MDCVAGFVFDMLFLFVERLEMMLFLFVVCAIWYGLVVTKFMFLYCSVEIVLWLFFLVQKLQLYFVVFFGYRPWPFLLTLGSGLTSL